MLNADGLRKSSDFDVALKKGAASSRTVSYENSAALLPLRERLPKQLTSSTTLLVHYPQKHQGAAFELDIVLFRTDQRTFSGIGRR